MLRRPLGAVPSPETQAVEAVRANAPEAEILPPTGELSAADKARADAVFKELAAANKPRSAKPPKVAPVKPTRSSVTTRVPAGAPPTAEQAALRAELDAAEGNAPPPEGGAPVPVPKPTAPRAPTGAAASPDVARLGTGTDADKFGNPRGTVYHGTPEDYARHQSLRQQMAAFTQQMREKKPIDQALFARTFKEENDLRNKYGGMAPEPPKAVAPASTPAEGTVRVYSGSGGTAGAGQGGSWFTENAQRAASFGPDVTFVDVPKAVADAARQGIKTDYVLPDEWVRKAKPFKVEQKVHEIDEAVAPPAPRAAPVAPAPPASSVGLSAPVDVTQPTKPKKPYNMASLRAPADEFKQLVLENGEQQGWIKRPDFVHPGATGYAAISHNTEMTAAYKRALDAIGIKADRNTLKLHAEALPKLKAFLEAHAKLEPVALENMGEGSEFTINGEKFTVGKTSADSGKVTIADGRTFKVDAQGMVKIDPGSLKAVEMPTDFGPEPEAPTPKLRPGEKGTADLLQGPEAPFNLAGETQGDPARIAAEAKAKADSAAAAKALAAKQQPDLFGTAPLVNPPAGPEPAYSGIHIPGVEGVLDRVTEGAKALPAGIRNAWRSASMQALPRITDSNRLAGEAGVRLDASRTVARAKGIEFADKVTDGIKDKTFDLKFGTALSEDNLRDLKRQAEETARTVTDPAEQMAAQARADAVSTMIGQPNSPFATESDYQAFMRTPEAQQALAKHIALWDTDKDPIFRQAMDLDPDQPLPTRGVQFGARVNLKNVLRDQGTKTTVGSNVRSPLIRATATLKRTDPFGRTATGSGSYEGSYQEIMANGFAREYPVAKQHEFIRELIAGGDAKLSKREFDPESEIKGESTKGYPLKMRPWSGQYLQIRKSLAHEYEDVSGLSAAIRAGPYSVVADALTRSSIMGLSEGSTHAGNLLTQVFTGLGPSSNPLINAVIKATGRADVLYSLPKVVINAFADRKADMLKLAEIGAAKEPYHGAIGWFITKIDKGVRLYSADVYKKMAAKGWVEDTETGLREYVNQVGQYSKRLQPRWIQVLRSTGVQPFATAMQTFNVQGLRTMVGAPGAKAPSNIAALALRADKAAGILGFAVTVTALNYLVSGTAAGPQGTRLGAVGWIGDDERLHQFDVGMLTGFTRGARVTGIQGFVEAKRSGLGTGSALLAGAQGVGNTAISAATGPANRFAFMALTGKRPSIPPVQEAAVAVPQSEEDFSFIKSQVAKNILEAVKQANPIADATARVVQGKYEEAATRQLSRYTPRTGMATETIEALPKIVAAGELHNYTDALAKEARKQPLGFDRNTFVREKLDDDNLDLAMRAKAMRELQMKGLFKYK
jgi:hypothetical protein